MMMLLLMGMAMLMTMIATHWLPTQALVGTG
jgi:hypothetical protein